MAVGNITNTIPASELPVMAEEEFLANVKVVTVDGTGRLKQIPRPALFNTIANVVQKGDKGDKGDTGSQGLQGVKGDKGDKGDTGAQGAVGATGATGVQGSQGFSGWTPVLSVVARGANEQVLQVVNWTNPNPSATNKPQFPLYVGSTGLTVNISDAINIKGATGAQGLQGLQGLNGTNGTNGWSPIITLVEDDTTNLVYFYLDSWIGGTGAAPTTIGYMSTEGITPSPVAGSDIGSLPITVSFSELSDVPTTLSGYGITNHNESGQVKVSYTGLSVSNFTANVYKAFNIISATTTVSPSPTTSYPFSTPKSYAGVFDGARGNTPNGRLIENPVAGQVHAWRIQGSYSGKSTAGSEVELLYLRIRNPVSGFQIIKNIVLPNDIASASVYEEIITIADDASISAPNGYILEAAYSKTDAGLSVQIDNITRISYAVEMNK